MSWLRLPIVHFLVGGALLYGVVHGPLAVTTAADAARPEPVVFDAADLAHLRDDYVRETGLQPTAADEAVLAQRAYEEELLFREAIARGLDRDDPSVRNWLVEQMAVLSPGADHDPDRLYERARELGLDRTDLVVRRILVQKMRLVATRLGERAPSDTELRAFWERHRNEYRTPDRVSFHHVFLASAVRGAALAGDAATMLASLQAGGVTPDEAIRFGDAFALAPRVVGRSEAQVATVFGAAFAAAVMQGAPGRWIGPLRSAHGLHLVWIDHRETGAVPPLAAVRGRLEQRWLQEQRAARLAALLAELRARHPLEVAAAAWREGDRS